MLYNFKYSKILSNDYYRAKRKTIAAQTWLRVHIVRLGSHFLSTIHVYEKRTADVPIKIYFVSLVNIRLVVN